MMRRGALRVTRYQARSSSCNPVPIAASISGILQSVNDKLGKS
jgi:hypothetical protein